MGSGIGATLRIPTLVGVALGDQGTVRPITIGQLLKEGYPCEST